MCLRPTWNNPLRCAPCLPWWPGTCFKTGRWPESVSGNTTRPKTPYLKDPHTGLPLTITKSLTQHNVLLAYLTETGLIGLVALLGLLSQFARMSWSVWRDYRLQLWPRQIALIGLVLVSAYCINGMFHDVSIVPQMHMLLFFLDGIGQQRLLTSRTDDATVPG